MIKSTDHGLAEFERKLKERLTVTVGIHEAEGSDPKREPDHKTQEQEQARRFREAGSAGIREEKLAAKLASFKGTLKARAKLEAKLARAQTYTTFMGSRAAGFAESRSATVDSGLSLIEVAEDHEFGLTVPMRSFVRGAVDDHPELEAKYAESMRKALKPGGRGVEQQAQRFGLYVVGLMQQRIADGIPPELSPATLKYKASLNISANAKETPLILTGQLRSSIRAKVEKT